MAHQFGEALEVWSDWEATYIDTGQYCVEIPIHVDLERVLEPAAGWPDDNDREETEPVAMTWSEIIDRLEEAYYELREARNE